MTVGVHGSKIVLRAGHSLIGSLAVPLCRCGIIPWYSLGGVVDETEGELRVPIAAFCKGQ